MHKAPPRRQERFLQITTACDYSNNVVLVFIPTSQLFKRIQCEFSIRDTVVAFSIFCCSQRDIIYGSQVYGGPAFL